MCFGTNLQQLRKMCGGMTQEDLAGRLGVTRQTVSRWELEDAYPEIDKIKQLCRLFSCTMDRLFMEDMSAMDGPYSHIRVELVPAMRYLRYTVISPDPETDAIQRVTGWAREAGFPQPDIIGWDFPFVTQEQVNVYHMHGYAAAWLLPEGFMPSAPDAEVFRQPPQKYAAITIDGPFQEPFRVIPNAYKTLMEYMAVNKLEHKEHKDILSCFEREYRQDGREFMDIFIAVKE